MRTPLLLLLFASALILPAQEYYDDAQLRTHLSLETKLGKRFTVHLDQQYRFTNNVSEFTRGSADIGLTYKVSKHIKLLADYVFIEKKKKAGYFSQRNWYYGAVVLKHDINYWRFVFRGMVQARQGDMNSEEQDQFRIYNRNKLSIRYQLTKRFTVYGAQEIYIPLNNPQVTGIDRSRTAFGTVINTFKNQQLEFYFMYQVRTQKGDWWDQSDKYPNDLLKRDFIYGIGYGIEF